MSGTVRRSPIRLARPYSPFPVSVLVLFVWWVVAHNSGSGWVQVLGDAVFGMMVIGLLAPAAALARVRIEVVRAPSDGGAGTPSVIAVRSSARTRIEPLDPPGPAVFVGRNGSGTDGDITLLPVRRGLHTEVSLEVATAAPFGLQWWRRQITFQLPTPLHVAPRMGRPIDMPNWLDERPGSRGRVLPAEAGDARGVREYRPGDRRRRVHWGATAHSGRLMVREMEEPSSQPITLKVALPTDEHAAERVAEQAFGTVVALLDRGIPVILSTDENGDSVIAPVADRREAGRRLARATRGAGLAGVELRQ